MPKSPNSPLLDNGLLKHVSVTMNRRTVRGSDLYSIFPEVIKWGHIIDSAFVHFISESSDNSEGSPRVPCSAVEC
jgi:hypothetical protein